MDIWGTKAARLQRQLDQTQENLKEAHEIIKQQQGMFSNIVEVAAKVPPTTSGAAILFMQNRMRKVVETEGE